MPNGGTLAIAVDTVNLSDNDVAQRPGLSAGEHAVVKVSDTGIGMSPEVEARIFEPFFSTKDTGKGTGLGLSMVYGFVKQSGGFIGVSSTLGKGTTFELYFPIAAAAALPADSSVTTNAATLSQGSGQVVLAVDDQSEVRETAVAHLKSLGYQVIEADSAKNALKKIIADPSIDLLFTDIVMPGGVDGFDLAAFARMQRPDLKILYTSGYTGDGNRVPANNEVDGVLLQKPYRKQELAKAVAEVLAAAA
jgi:CheY-like chemotaxis protein